MEKTDKIDPDLKKKSRWGPLGGVLVLSALFFISFMAISGVLYIAQAPRSGQGVGRAASLFSGGSVGVLEVSGVILDSKKTLAKLERFEENDQIKAVVVRLNSPGGAVAPSQEIYEAVKNYSKPLVVSMGSVAASGAYYIACGAKKVFANAGTMTGSIGVIMEFADLEKLYQWAKIHRYVVKTGQFKDIGSEYREMTPSEKKLLQTMIDDVLAQFKSAIVAGRKLTLAQVSALADGRIFSGSQAKAVHLVDEIGTIRDAIQEAGKLAGIKGKPNVVNFEKTKRSWLELLADDSSFADGQDSSLAFSVNGAIRKVLGMIVAPSAENLESSITFPPGLYSVLHSPGMH